MKETIEFRISYDYAHLLFDEKEGRCLGTSVKIIELSKDDPRYEQIPIIEKEVETRYGRGFFFGWKIKRKYSKKELDEAALFHVKINFVFEPTGEQCGTVYDEASACKICGANARQITLLKLKKGSIPKKDIAETIGGEVVVSEKFVSAVRERHLKGLAFNPVRFARGPSNYYQLKASMEIDLSSKTVVGNNPFRVSAGSPGGVYTICGYTVRFEKEVYICPEKDLIGLNLLSEPYVVNDKSIGEYDFFASKQRLGVRRGVLRPEPIYLCSQSFRKMVLEEKLSGFGFEVANIVDSE